MNKFNSTLLILLILSTKIFSVNYYLSTNGNNTNDGKSFSNPFQTLSYALGKLIAGDTLFISSGTYPNTATLSIKLNGNASNRICIFPLNSSERPVIDFSAMPYSSSNRGISLTGSYWHIKGIRIKGAGDNGMNMTGSYNIIEYCDFFENHDSGLQLVGGAHDNQIINCDSYRNADYGPGISDNGGDADGFCPKMDVGSNNYFYGCRAWENSDDGWDGYLRGTNEVTTILENCWTWKNGYYWIDGYTNSSMNGNGFKQGGSDTKDLAHNFILKNCLSFYNKANGFDQNSSTGSQTMYNCTSVANMGRSYYFNSSVTLPAEKVFTLTNCVAYNNSSTSFRTGTLLTTNNFACASSQFSSTDTTGVSGPRKADGSLPNIQFMHLQSKSSLIDSGTNTGLPFLGIAPDLGCFEFNPFTIIEQVNSNKNQQVISFINDGFMYFKYPDPNLKVDSIFIFDTEGRLVQKISINGSDLNSIKLDVSNFRSGILLTQINCRNSVLYSKTLVRNASPYSSGATRHIQSKSVN